MSYFSEAGLNQWESGDSSFFRKFMQMPLVCLEGGE